MSEITLTALTPVATLAGYRQTVAAARQMLRAQQLEAGPELNEDQWRQFARLIVLLGELETWLGELEREHGAWLAPREP